MSPLDDDDPEKWIYKKHTYAKHELLHYYLEFWASKVSHNHYNLRVYDCFAGRGTYTRTDDADPFQLTNIETETEIPGSPQIILDAVSKHEKHFNAAECYFLEPIDSNRKLLQQQIDETLVPENVSPKVLDSKFPDDIQDTITQTGAERGFAFFFIDPFNIKFIEYDTICKIAGTERWETLITLMTGQLIRWRESKDHQEGYKSLYGERNWKEQLENFEPEFAMYKEAEYYQLRLEENGPNYTLPYMIKSGESRELKYHLIFTTNSEEGMDAMSESMNRVGTKYTLAHAPADPRVEPGRAWFGKDGFITEEEAAKSWLMTKFAGQTVTLDEIKKVASVERSYHPSLRKDYRAYLKDLDDTGEISAVGRELEGPLPDDMPIIFPESTTE